MQETRESGTVTDVLSEIKLEDDAIMVSDKRARDRFLTRAIPKILIVDDSVFMRMILKNTLTKNGFNDIVEARNGLEAIEAFQRYKPDLVFLDIIMPENDGINALKRILDIDKDAEVVMLTAVGQEESRKECLRLGAVDYIVKPFGEQRVVEVLQRFV